MLVCNVSLRPQRSAIAADLAEAAAAADVVTRTIALGVLLDEPASASDTLGAFVGQVMVEAASASDTTNAGLILGVAVNEPAAAIDDVSSPAASWAITSSNTASVAENATLSHALTANESVTWSIVGGVDLTHFELSGSTLRWISNSTKDYETPDDADIDHAYLVTVRATNAASNTADQTITVTVTDVSEVVEAATATDDPSASVTAAPSDDWTLVNSWTHSGNVAQVDFTGLAGYTEVRVVLRNVDAITGGTYRQLLVSTDNGSTFLTASGDYVEVNAAGSEANQSSLGFASAIGSGVRSGEIMISGWNLTTPKSAELRNLTNIYYNIIPTTSALNALRVKNSSGDLSAGSIYVFAR